MRGCERVEHNTRMVSYTQLHTTHINTHLCIVQESACVCVKERQTDSEGRRDGDRREEAETDTEKQERRTKMHTDAHQHSQALNIRKLTAALSDSITSSSTTSFSYSSSTTTTTTTTLMPPLSLQKREVVVESCWESLQCAPARRSEASQVRVCSSLVNQARFLVLWSS